MNTFRKYWSLEELARYLNVPKTWIYDRTRIQRPDRIPHFKLGKYLRFDPDSNEFKTWLQRTFRNLRSNLLTTPNTNPILRTTVERQCGSRRKGTRMSFQDGWIEVKKRKHRTQFLLRYWVRDLSWPEGWKKKSEILKGCTTRKQAERERIRRMEEINKSNQASASTMLGPTAMTLEDFSRTVWPHYLQTRGAKESTVYGYESLLRAHILPALGSKRLDQITPTDVSVFLNRLAKSKEKPTPKGGPKLLNVYALLRTMFEVAVESGLILASPVRKKIHRPKYRVAETTGSGSGAAAGGTGEDPGILDAVFSVLGADDVADW